ncbi:hypothetical protein RZS08_54220, partial [Arthrospira platensis SPKY1]|nr:hypothetical protein [Arthrospira platensis SPKY1]
MSKVAQHGLGQGLVQTRHGMRQLPGLSERFRQVLGTVFRRIKPVGVGRPQQRDRLQRFGPG